MVFPVEIVLKIVKHLHTPITYRHYERRRKIFRTILRFWRIAMFSNYPEHVILEVKKYDPEIRNVTTAKNLRLVCKDFAYAYGLYYIHHNIEGSFMRKQYSSVIRFNGSVWNDNIKMEHALNLLIKNIFFLPISRL